MQFSLSKSRRVLFFKTQYGDIADCEVHVGYNISEVTDNLLHRLDSLPCSAQDYLNALNKDETKIITKILNDPPSFVKFITNYGSYSVDYTPFIKLVDVVKTLVTKQSKIELANSISTISNLNMNDDYTKDTEKGVETKGFKRKGKVK